MIALDRKKWGIKIREVFFAEDPTTFDQTPSIHFFVQAHAPHPRFTPFQTSLIDLSRPDESLSAPISKNTRYKINRAEREGMVARLLENPTDKEAEFYANFYNTFARQKRLPPCNTTKLRALCQRSALLLSSVSDSDGDLLAAHAYVKDASIARVRLLYSASHFRNLEDSGQRNKIGRANRLLHWYEILALKKNGYQLYDLGGLPLDSSDSQKNEIARFKLEFGGARRIEYNGFIPSNLMGHLLLSLSTRRP